MFCIIEAADAAVEYDRAKLPLYAEAGAPETWIVDLQAERLEVHREPRGPRYVRSVVLQRGETVSIEAFPGITLNTSDLFG